MYGSLSFLISQALKDPNKSDTRSGDNSLCTEAICQNQERF